jgi:hypothetical protein
MLSGTSALLLQHGSCECLASEAIVTNSILYYFVGLTRQVKKEQCLNNTFSLVRSQENQQSGFKKPSGSEFGCETGIPQFVQIATGLPETPKISLDLRNHALMFLSNCKKEKRPRCASGDFCQCNSTAWGQTKF